MILDAARIRRVMYKAVVLSRLFKRTLGGGRCTPVVFLTRRVSNNGLRFVSIPRIHLAAVARRIGQLTLERDDIFLKAADAQLVFVLHAGKARFELTDDAPEVAGLLTGNFPEAAPR